MAVPSLTGSSSSASSSGASSLTWSHTSNSDPLLVLVCWHNSLPPYGISVTFNGVAMTFGGRLHAGTQLSVFEWYYTQSPGSFTANIVATGTASGWITAGGHNVNSASFALAGPFGFAVAEGSGTGPTIDVASSTSCLVLDMVTSDVVNQTFTQGAGQTLVHAQNDATSNMKSGSSTEGGAAGTTTMSWTLGLSESAWAIVGMSLVDPTVDADVRLTQHGVELGESGTSDQRVSQLGVELGESGTSDQRVSQLGVDLGNSGTSSYRMSQFGLEVAWVFVVPLAFTPSAGTERLIRKVRRSPTFSTEKTWNFFTRFEIDFQAGGPREPMTPIALSLRYSNDAGNTWSDAMLVDADTTGDYDAIAEWYRLGRARDRVWEVSSSSPAMTVWLSAYLDVTPGTH